MTCTKLEFKRDGARYVGVRRVQVRRIEDDLPLGHDAHR